MENTKKFEFNVPDLEGFSELDMDEDVQKIESFFDNKEDDKTPFAPVSEIESFFTPSASASASVVEKVRPVSTLRKSMSTSCLLPKSKKTGDISDQFKKMNLTSNKCGARKTFYSASSSRLFSNENLYKTRSKDGLNGSTKYMSDAEVIYKFLNKTPARFHKAPVGEKIVIPKLPKPTMTIPYSPALATKKRHRMTQVVSSDEKELMEFQEAQTHKFKAHPINTKILNQADAKVAIKKKTPTKIQPFNITEVQKKVFKTPEKPKYEFHARPISESVFKPQIPQIKAHITTQAITPSFVRKRNEKLKQMSKLEYKEEKKQPVKPVRLTSTVPIPFSFEKRDVDTQVKKEQKIQKVIEEEKKLMEFHARPVPRKILESPTIAPKKSFSCDSILSNRSDDTDSCASTGFKARPASVLKAKPFIPKKAERTLVEICNVQLNSEQRALARAEYDQQMKEKERLIEELKQKELELQLKAQEEEVKKIRKQSQHFAQPIRKYKELKKIDPKPLTVPNGPKFCSGKSHDKENSM